MFFAVSKNAVSSQISIPGSVENSGAARPLGAGGLAIGIIVGSTLVSVAMPLALSDSLASGCPTWKALLGG